MISLRGLVLVVLTVKGLECVSANNQIMSETAWSSPVYFSYEKWNQLNIDVHLLNIPSGANQYALYYETENCDVNWRERCYEDCNRKWYQGCQDNCVEDGSQRCNDGRPETDMMPIDFKIPIKKQLMDESVKLDIQLLCNNKNCSSKQNIMYGVRVPKKDSEGHTFHRKCLNKNYNLCNITVDFSNPAMKNSEEKVPTKCTLNGKRLTCKVKQLAEDTVHQWYQRYNDDSLIGTIPAVTGKKSKFVLWVNKFDSYSYIFDKIKTTRWNSNITTEEYMVHLQNKTYDSVVDKKTYLESEPVSFNCPNDARAQVGLIDPTGYRITTYGKANHSLMLSKKDNSSMFCCLRYDKTGENTDEITITRFVEEVTVFLYQYKEPVNQDRANTDATEEPSISTSTSSTTPRSSKITPSRVTLPQDSSDAPIKTNSSQPVMTQKPTSTENLPTTIETKITTLPPTSVQDETSTKNSLTDELNGSPGSSDKTKYYIAIASAAGIILVISLIYVIVKKCTRKGSHPKETLQLETYASANMVYAELDVRPSNAPASLNTENTTYAEIIGVLRPVHENGKK